MARSKLIRMDYFAVVNHEIIKDEEEREVIQATYMDLSGALKRLSSMPAEERVSTNIFGEQIRFQEVNEKMHKTKKNDDGTPYLYWELEILKERVGILPGIAKSNGCFDSIPVDEGDSISEDITALYDPQICLMLVFRKKEGLSPSGIGDFFSRVMEDKIITLNPIMDSHDLDVFTNDKIYRSIEIAVCKNNETRTHKALRGIIKDSEELCAINYEIKFGVGKAKKGVSLNPAKVIETIKDYWKNSDTSRLKIKMKNDEDSVVEPYDLIKERLHETRKFKYSKESPITHKGYLILWKLHILRDCLV